MWGPWSTISASDRLTDRGRSPDLSTPSTSVLGLAPPAQRGRCAAVRLDNDEVVWRCRASPMSALREFPVPDLAEILKEGKRCQLESEYDLKDDAARVVFLRATQRAEDDARRPAVNAAAAAQFSFELDDTARDGLLRATLRAEKAPDEDEDKNANDFGEDFVLDDAARDELLRATLHAEQEEKRRAALRAEADATTRCAGNT